jgi:hypothetical protein
MKFLCIECDEQMQFEERQQPGDGTFGAAFRCPACNRAVAMLANPMETQLVGALGVKIGGRTLDEQPLELVRSNVVGRDDAFIDEEAGRRVGGSAGVAAAGTVKGDGTESRPGDPATRLSPIWTPDAEDRLSRVPSFVRGMVKKIYREYADERGIREITPAVMDRARTELGLEGM